MLNHIALIKPQNERTHPNSRTMMAYDTKDPSEEEQSCTNSIVKRKNDWSGCKSNRK